jgi:hypothetical protein
MQGFVRWMNGSSGRVARAVAGVALIAVGIATSGAGGVALGAVGAVALTAGGTGMCFAAPLAHLRLTEGR